MLAERAGLPCIRRKGFFALFPHAQQSMHTGSVRASLKNIAPSSPNAPHLALHAGDLVQLIGVRRAELHLRLNLGPKAAVQ